MTEASESNKTQTIIVVGDSISAGYGVSKDKAYPALLEKELIKRGHDIKIVNGAESGALSSAALNRLKFYTQRVKPDILLLAIGGNDARAQKPVNIIESNLEKTITWAKENNLKVILAGQKIFTNFGPEYGGSFESLYKKLAKKHELIFIPFLLDGVGGVKKMNIADGFHPNEEGHQKIMQTTLPFILEAL